MTQLAPWVVRGSGAWYALAIILHGCWLTSCVGSGCRSMGVVGIVVLFVVAVQPQMFVGQAFVGH